MGKRSRESGRPKRTTKTPYRYRTAPEDTTEPQPSTSHEDEEHGEMLALSARVRALEAQLRHNSQQRDTNDLNREPPEGTTLMRTIRSLGAHPLHHQHPIQDVVAPTNGKDGHDPIPPDTDGGGLRLHQYGKEMRTLIQVLRRYLILLRTLSPRSPRTQTRSPKQNRAVGPSCHLALVLAKTLAKSYARKSLIIDTLI